MDLAEQAVQSVYAGLPAEKIADATSENNRNNRFVMMMNKHGREVPVPEYRIPDALKRGYIHIDNQIKSDDLTQDVRKTTKRKKSEKAQLAEALTKVAEAVAPKEEKKEKESTKK